MSAFSASSVPMNRPRGGSEYGVRGEVVGF